MKSVGSRCSGMSLIKKTGLGACLVAVVFAAVVFVAENVSADVALSGIFSDGMVLQRGMKNPVWGTADPGEEVTVSIDGQSKSTKAGSDGRWSLKLGKMKAGGPFEMSVKGKNSLNINDIMVGEVWLCSGQSNMAWTVKRTTEYENNKNAFDIANIRMVTIDRKKSETPLDDFPNGAPKWVTASAQTIERLSAVGYYFARELDREFGVPIGIINASWGGSQIESWMPSDAIDQRDPILSPILPRWEEMHASYPEKRAEFEKKEAAWKKAQTEGRNDVPRPWAPGGARREDFPAGIYNASIHPLFSYGIKGFVWYQGESNSQRGYQYRTLLKSMITAWRKQWGKRSLPFIVIQLANWETDTNPYSPKDGGCWQELREAQLMALDLPKTALVVTIDIGTVDDIHPRRKTEVGRRVALAARKIAYNQNVTYSGPLFKSMKVKNGSAVLKFSHVAEGLVAKGGALKGFELAGKDKVYHKAKARIDGKTVVVTSAAVVRPAAVRYAWDDNPDCNLYNSAGLPASPFRSDDWQRETQDRLKPYGW